ncbi:MAG TPA: hypothetical protein DCM71_28495 [Runella sp.]|jgi:putative ABC transport system permease protein|nr:hypothetical protein [Runella sp.]
MTKRYWNKIKQDLSYNRFRVLLVVMSLLVATAALSAISSSFWVLRSEMNADFLSTNPASATLWFETNTEKDIVKALESYPSVAQAELRKTIEGRIEVAPHVWQTLILFVVHDFNTLKINRFEFDTGTNGEINTVVIERSCVTVAKAQIGDSLTVQVKSNKRAKLKLTGIVHDPAQAPGWMHGEVFGYINPATLKRLGLPPMENAVKLTLKNAAKDRIEAQRQVLEIRHFLEIRGYKIVRADVPPPATHPHDRQLNAISSILLAFSLIILVLSSVVIANMMNGFLTRQIKQIGIMKALGGSSSQIKALYFLFIAVMVSLAVPLGWALSFPIAKAFTAFVSNQLNFDIANAYPPFYLFLLQTGVCTLVPFVFGLFPVWRTTKKSVLNALTDEGLSEKPTNAFWQEIGQYMSRPLLLTLRNTFRKKSRFWLTMGSLALGGAAFMASFNVQEAWKSTIAEVEAKQRYDIDVKLFAPISISKMDTLLRTIPTIKNYEAWSSAKTFVKYADKTESMRYELSGMPQSPQFYTPSIQEGKALSAKPGENELVATRSLLFLEPQLKVGEAVTLMINNKATSWRLVGVTYEADAEPTFYTHKTSFDKIANTPNQAAHFRLITVEKRTDVALLTIEKGLTKLNASVRLTKEAHVLEQNFKDHFTIIINMLLVIAFFLASVGLMGLSSTLSMNVLERMKEFGIMQAIGATGNQISRIILIEGLIISVLSWLLACLIALPISFGMDVAIGNVGLLKPLNFVISWLAILGWLVAVIVFSFIVGTFPAVQARRLSIREILGHE